ncbi:MAG: 50S ribosomal protein L3 [Verrucomicrobia bacterium]|nr:50S ribosomal protein L3 [Verrucomicrobiota bacterium]
MAPKFKLMGVKQGMMQLFDEKGSVVVCSVISTEKHVVSQLKKKDTDGYEALQLACFKVKPSKAKNLPKPQVGHYKKAGVEPRAKSCEVRVENLDSYQLGQEIGVESFQEIPFVDVIGVSKGKGYQGVIKRHHFAGGPAAHGSGFHRHGGSCGMRTSPGRCLPGQKKAGRMGGERVTVESLRVVKIDAEKQVILVAGPIPGSRGGLVYIAPAKKKLAQKKK